MKKNVVLTGALCAALLVSGCSAKKTEAAGTDARFVSQNAQTVFSVKTEPVVVQDLKPYIDTNGDVEAVKQVEVYPDMTGKLIAVHVALGSRVTKGQVIAEIDPSIPGATYSRSPVYAPITGTITSVPLQTGTTVNVSTPVAMVGDIDNLQINAHIPERYIGLLRTGLSAVLEVESHPGVSFQAEVIRVSPVVDAVSRTKQIYLTLKKDDSRINAGMYAKVRLYTTVQADCITVPEAAIVSSFGSNYVFVLNSDGTVSKREVAKGITVNGVCQILSGVSANERVVTQGMQVLSDGSKVKDISGTQTSAIQKTAMLTGVR